MSQNKVLQNAKWIIGCKIAQSVLQLVIGMFTARYLGPSNYGLISYAASLVAFVTPFMQLGLSYTLVQEYIDAPEQQGQIMGTSLVLNLFSSVACIAAVIFVAVISQPNEPETVIVCALYSLMLIFQAFEMIQCWYQANYLSKYSSLILLGAYIVVSTYKVFSLVTQKSVRWFALSHTVEACVIGGALILIYWHLCGNRLSFSLALAKQLLAKSRHYIVPSLMVSLFGSVDRMLLQRMVGLEQTGYYAAAVTCAGVVSFVYMAIIDSARPAILEKRKESKDAFEKHMISLYSVLIYLGLAQSAVFTLCAKPIVTLLYGSEYSPAISALQIVVWYIVFSYMGKVRNIWILAEEKHNVLWKVNSFGAISSIILNLVFISIWGINGAALAALLTQFVTNFILGFCIKDLRANNLLLLKSWDLRVFLGIVKKLVKRFLVTE